MDLQGEENHVDPHGDRMETTHRYPPVETPLTSIIINEEATDMYAGYYAACIQRSWRFFVFPARLLVTLQSVTINIHNKYKFEIRGRGWCVITTKNNDLLALLTAPSSSITAVLLLG